MKRVLIVDDNDQNRYFLQALMQGSGFEVEEARHGAEALVKARQTPPQLIISDLLMPVMDGYTLLRHWKTDEQLKNIPFVVYTSTYTAEQDERLALDMGADIFIIKPTEPESFMENIHEVLLRQKKGKLPQAKHSSGNEEGLLQQYSAVLLRKLESKMLQLEEKNRALEQNIIERKRVEEALRAQKDLLNTILENEPECVKLLAPDGKLLQMNRAGLNMLEVDSLEELQQFKLLDFILPDSRVAFMDLFNSVFVGGSGILEFQVQGHRGTQRWLETHAVPLRDKHGQITALLGVTRDITGRKQSEELIWRQVNFDLLTGLPNRHMFHDHLQHEIKKSDRGELQLALLLIDLDHFKEVNDTLGHDKGDILLQEVARRISACVRNSDMVARLGGDEFTVILTELPEHNFGSDIAQKIISSLSEPYNLGNEIVYVSASIGITVYPDDSSDVDVLMKNADQAMYLSKKNGRNRSSYFTPALQAAAQTRLRLINDLRGALAANQFRVYFQPIVEMATGNIHKAEALLRWQHPTRGMVSPEEFIHLAEDTGLIIEIGDWVFNVAARQVQRLRAVHHPQFQISVNKSPIQFRDDGSHHNAWYAYLQELNLPGQSIAVEITEGLLLDAASVVTEKLLAFRDAGIQVALDDFGTGYSSLSYLKKFDIDYLKIDQSFTRNLAPGSSDMALSEAIIVMAHKLDLQVIAEGVETEEQRELLVAAGCDYAQGYLFAKPMPAKEFEKWLAMSGSGNNH